MDLMIVPLERRKWHLIHVPSPGHNEPGGPGIKLVRRALSISNLVPPISWLDSLGKELERREQAFSQALLNPEQAGPVQVHRHQACRHTTTSVTVTGRAPSHSRLSITRRCSISVWVHSTCTISTRVSPEGQLQAMRTSALSPVWLSYTSSAMAPFWMLTVITTAPATTMRSSNSRTTQASEYRTGLLCSTLTSKAISRSGGACPRR